VAGGTQGQVGDARTLRIGCVIALVMLVVGAGIVLILRAPRVPEAQYRPELGDLVVSAVGDPEGYSVVLRSGERLRLLLERGPGSGIVQQGDLVIGGRGPEPAWWFATTPVGMGGRACYGIGGGATIVDGRMVMDSGLSLEIVEWYDPMSNMATPVPGTRTDASLGLCLDDHGRVWARGLGMG
jgi:hypothetical protein